MNDVSDTAALPADTPPAEVVRCYWQRMQGRDFRGVAPLLGPELTVDWPQSNERFRGPERFLQMNREYPAHGPWTVQLHRLVADGAQVVTQVTVGDGVQRAEPVSFFEVAAGRIRRIVEYWPEPFAPATDRRHLSEPIAEVGVDASAGAEPGAAADAAGAPRPCPRRRRRCRAC
ncbi:nuclear transport factor 2 family protein [Piscinibacter sakaiensis]|uniref:nuclear transport factor 2 family protein n=1 Tax=Piscinibacter sakaiensis TaxID=1547922 RepID=UPI00372C49B0